MPLYAQQTQEPGLLRKLLAFVLAAVLLVVGFMFSVVLLAIVVGAGLVAWGYFWWKTRELHKAMREDPPGRRVFDGEVVSVDEPDTRRPVVLPGARPLP
jgi:hypothetical protein